MPLSDGKDQGCGSAGGGRVAGAGRADWTCADVKTDQTLVGVRSRPRWNGWSVGRREL